MNTDEACKVSSDEERHFAKMSSDDPEFEAELLRRSGDWEGAVPWEQLRDEPCGSV